MNVLFDTSVLVAATIKSHPSHGACRPWVKAARAGKIGYFVSCHTLAEFYRVLTSIRISPGYTSSAVWQIIVNDVLNYADIVELTSADYSDCLLRLSQANERGGIVFDGLIVQAAFKAGVDHLLTLNSSHFERVWPNHTHEVINPQTTQAP